MQSFFSTTFCNSTFATCCLLWLAATLAGVEATATCAASLHWSTLSALGFPDLAQKVPESTRKEKAAEGTENDTTEFLDLLDAESWSEEEVRQ